MKKEKDNWNEKSDNKNLRYGIILFLLIISTLLIVIPEEILKDPTIVGKAVGVVRILGSNPPTFDHDLEDFSLYQNESLWYDINCSDPDFEDEITYLINHTGIGINETTGIINITWFNQSFVGNHTIEITCQDLYYYNTSDTFNLEIKDINEPPVLKQIGNLLATEGEAYVLDLDATDPENDTLTYGAVTSLFTIDNETGFLNFTPTLAQVGNHTINFTVFDGELYDWEVVILTIVRGPYCGDGSCGFDETCFNCPEDCGTCPPPPEVPEKEPPPAVTSPVVSPQALLPPQTCIEKWECSEWTPCPPEEFHTRVCEDINNCGTRNNKPEEIEECEYIPTCFDGIMNGDEEGVDCGGSCPPCFFATCFDGIKNCHDGLCEEDIDCGGPCPPCDIEEKKKGPEIQIAQAIDFPKKFPWLLVLIVLLLSIIAYIADKYHEHKLRKKKLEEFIEEFREFRPIRRKLYKILLNTNIITWIISMHIYYFSNDYENMLLFSFIPILLIIGVPFGVAYIIRKLEYLEYKMMMKEKKMQKRHKRELLQLVKTENELLIGLEIKLQKNISQKAQNHDFDSFPEFYNIVNPIYGTMSKIIKGRKERKEILKIPYHIMDKIISLFNDEMLKLLSKEYPEFMSIKKNLFKIDDNKDLDTAFIEDDYMDDVMEISLPFLKSIILGEKKYIKLYNSLVEVFDYFKEKNKELLDKDARTMEIEREFVDAVKDIAKDGKMIKLINENPPFVKLYNSMVDLFNHYTKKFSLSKAIKEL